MRTQLAVSTVNAPIPTYGDSTQLISPVDYPGTLSDAIEHDASLHNDFKHHYLFFHGFILSFVRVVCARAEGVGRGEGSWERLEREGGGVGGEACYKRYFSV